MKYVLLGVLLCFLCVLSYGGYTWYQLDKEHRALTVAYESVTQTLFETEEERNTLAQQLEEERTINESFTKRIGAIAETVGVLEKLSKTDEELLQKYSRVYFLNENYVPSDLSLIASSSTVNGDEEYFHSKALPFLLALIAAAEKDTIVLKVVSGYRSFGTQAQLKGAYVKTYGSNSNTFSADQGFSEHQLGTTVDLSTETLGTSFTNIASDPAYTWLTTYAYRYGFILSYPKNNEFYQFEPWHWRFVGKKLALYLHNKERSFYELDQREIDEYLVTIFDN